MATYLDQLLSCSRGNLHSLQGVVQAHGYTINHLLGIPACTLNPLPRLQSWTCYFAIRIEELYSQVMAWNMLYIRAHFTTVKSAHFTHSESTFCHRALWTSATRSKPCNGVLPEYFHVFLHYHHETKIMHSNISTDFLCRKHTTLSRESQGVLFTGTNRRTPSGLYIR